MLAVTTAVQSGAWHDPGTWSNGVPNAALRAVIPAGNEVVLAGVDHVAEELVIQGGVLRVAESPGQTKTLTSDWIHVNSGGLFQVGTEQDRYDENDFVINLVGEGTGTTFTIEGAPGPLSDNNAFLMAVGGGRLQFFGEQKLTYTKLAATAEAGASQIVVEGAIDRDFDGVIDASDGSVNWGVGDQIVVASSTRDYRDEEVRTISAVADRGDGTFLLTLNTPLAKRHYGEVETYSRKAVQGDFNNDGVVDLADYTVWRDHLGDSNENALTGNGDGAAGVGLPDYDVWRSNLGAVAEAGARSWDLDLRAEVALLNRNVRVQGLASQDTDNAFGDRARFNAGAAEGFGGHIMIMPTAGQVTVDSVQLDRLGQTGRLGRYPFHWHLGGDRSGDVLHGVSITNSNNRGVTVHGTHNVLIQDVVLHDVHGHGFFMEDAVETGNTFLSNIALGIHKVGRSGDDIDLSDPFIVDTHDHVGQNSTRFLSSAAYWMTNPDNTWVGNVSAGSEGTGFWFLFPDSAIGLSAQDPQYAGARPDRVNLGRFDHNTSHSSPIGLNFDRGSDIEAPVGATLKPSFDGDEHRPSAEPQINYFTGYKHTTGIYHRGRTANFHENRLADNFTSTFITFTQRITDTLYVGHSRGNSDPGQIVTGHSFYDGANTLDGTHFAGFAAANAHMFRADFVAVRHTHFVVRDSSFENDGSADHVSFSSFNGGLSYAPVGKGQPSVLYDEDGTFTAHVGGGPGSTVVPNHPFFYDSGDVLPTGWNARVSDDLYGLFRMRSPSGQNPLFRVTTPDGDQGQNRPGAGQFAGTNTLVKADAGDYAVDFPEGLSTASNGFDIAYFVVRGPQTGSTVVRFTDMAATFSVNNRPFVSDLATLRGANQTVWTRSGGHLYVKFFSSQSLGQVVNFTPQVTQPVTLWEDESPLSGISSANSGFAVTTVNGSVTGDASRGQVGRVTQVGATRFSFIDAGSFPVDADHRGTDFEFRVDYFVPPNTTLDSPDFFYLQINFDGVNSGAAGFVGEGSAGTGWNTIVLSGTIPGNATQMFPRFILADGGLNTAAPNGDGTGVAFYVDNFRFTVGLAGSSAASTAEPAGVAFPAPSVGSGAIVDSVVVDTGSAGSPGAAPIDSRNRLLLLAGPRVADTDSVLREEAFARLEEEQAESVGEDRWLGGLSPLPSAPE